MALDAGDLSRRIGRLFHAVNRPWVGRRHRLNAGEELALLLNDVREHGVRAADTTTEDRLRAQRLLGVQHVYGGSVVPIISGSVGSVSWAALAEPDEYRRNLTHVTTVDGNNIAFLKAIVVGRPSDSAAGAELILAVWRRMSSEWSNGAPAGLVSFLKQANDILEGRGVSVGFAGVLCGVVDAEFGIVTLTHAGWPDVHVFRAITGRSKIHQLKPAPAIGAFPAEMLPPDQFWRSYRLRLEPGDSVVPLDEGDVLNGRGGNDCIVGSERTCVDESQLPISACSLTDQEWRDDPHIEPTLWNQETGPSGHVREWLGYDRIHGVINAVMQSATFTLTRYRDPVPPDLLVFDFGSIDPTVYNTVLAVYALELIFRLRGDPTAGPEDTASVPDEVAGLLETTFSGWEQFFGNEVCGVPDQHTDSGYRTFSHICSDPGYGRLILAIGRNR